MRFANVKLDSHRRRRRDDYEKASLDESASRLHRRCEPHPNGKKTDSRLPTEHLRTEHETFFADSFVASVVRIQQSDATQLD